VPRYRDEPFEDEFDRSPRRKGNGRQTAVADLGDELDERPDDATLDHGRRHDRRSGRGHRRAFADETAEPDEWDDEPLVPRGHKPRLADGSESFKCGHCKAFIGPTISGGRHRNHCPLCLYSRHVDDRRMGDRASSCRALMAPIGYFYRPKGEQVVVHRCLGCGFERHNRVAADDNFLVLAELPELPPRQGEEGEEGVPA
jgi:hypothetical protein